MGLLARSPAVDASPPTQRKEGIDPPALDVFLDLLEAA